VADLSVSSAIADADWDLGLKGLLYNKIIRQGGVERSKIEGISDSCQPISILF